MVHLIAGVAVVLCALFTGAAIYISLVEHPVPVIWAAHSLARLTDAGTRSQQRAPERDVAGQRR